MRDIVLSVTMEDEVNISNELRNHVLKEHKSQCYYCDIPLKTQFEIHQEGGKGYPACSFCYHALHLDKILSKNPGSIALFPEVPQVWINHIVRALHYLKEEGDQDLKDNMDIFSSVIKERIASASVYYAKNVDDISILSQFLYSLPATEYEKRSQGLFGLRFIPNPENYANDFAEWSSFLNQYHPSQWDFFVKRIKDNNKNVIKD